MTIVFAAHMSRYNALLADIFVDEGTHFSVAEKVFPCSWLPDTFIACLGDELFALILQNRLGDGPKRFSWPPVSSLDLGASNGMMRLAKMGTDYRKLLRSANQQPIEGGASLYVVNRESVARWEFSVGNDDIYRLVPNAPFILPEGYAFIDAGFAPNPYPVDQLVGDGEMTTLVTLVGSRSGRLPYHVGSSVTGVIIPRADSPIVSRCLCALTLEERTFRMKEATADAHALSESANPRSL